MSVGTIRQVTLAVMLMCESVCKLKLFFLVPHLIQSQVKLRDSSILTATAILVVKFLDYFSAMLYYLYSSFSKQHYMKRRALNLDKKTMAHPEIM